MTRKLSWVLLIACALVVPACFEHHTADEIVEQVPPYDGEDNVDGDEEPDEEEPDEEPDDQDDDPPRPRLDAGTGNSRRDAGVDAGSRDAGARDAGTRDAGARDAGARDAGADAGRDAGARDAGTRDAGFPGGLLGGGGSPGGAGSFAEILQELFGCDDPTEGLSQLICAILNGQGLPGVDGGVRGGFPGGGN